MAEDKKRGVGRPKGETGNAGRTMQKELSIYNSLKEMINTDTKVYYVMFKYCPEFLQKKDGKVIKTFDDLKSVYAVFTERHTEEVCEKYLLEERVQNAVKWLLKRLHQKKLVELYEIYFEKAKGDVQAFRAFQEFSKEFFKETKQSDLSRLLSRVPESDINIDDEDLSYSYDGE